MSKTVRVPHLGGIDVAYRLAQPIKQSKPTAVFITGLNNTVDSFAKQLDDEELRESLNLIAIEALGNGQTTVRSTETWTYWDAAIAALQAIDALSIRKAFVVGVSSGGFIATRMALYSPSVVLGLILTGTTMDGESPESIQRGNMDCISWQDGVIKETSAANESYSPPGDWGAQITKLSYGNAATDQDSTAWSELLQKNYSGDAGRKRLRQVFINMRTRDSLQPRLADITSPVLWLHGDQDTVYNKTTAQTEIKLFTGSPDATLQTFDTGHLVNVIKPAEWNKAFATFTAKYSDKPDARKLREAIGMVDI